MKTPPYLKANDTVGIVSTARMYSREDLQYGIDTLNSWGLRVVVGETIGAELNQYAGSDELRLRDMQFMLDSTDIDAVIFARGGYGTVRILDKLSFENFIENPKWLCGFSDVCVIHNHVNQNFGIETMHCTMPISFKSTFEESLESMKAALFGAKVSCTVPGHPYNSSGHASGELVGGNLSILYSLLGSSSQLNTEGKILFIEDLDEYLYHVDRMMMALKRAGMIHKLAGLLVGGLTSMNDNTIPFGKNAQEIVAEHVQSYHFPVAYGFPAGHIKDNRALILGRKADLSVSERRTTLAFE